MPNLPPFDISAEDFAALPGDKLLLRWPDGGGENVWVKHLPDGNVILDNDPLYPKYRHQDVVNPHTGDVVKRHFAHHLRHQYEALPDEEAEKDLRKTIWEAAKEVGADLSFFSRGWGHVLVPHDGDVKAVERALLVPGLCTVLEVLVFDVSTDKMINMTVDEYLEATP